MIGSVTDVRTCEYFHYALKAYNQVETAQSDAAIDYTVAAWSERFTTQFAPDRLKEALIAAELSSQTVARGNAMQATDIDNFYKEMEWNPYSQQMIAKLAISTFRCNEESEITQYLGVAMDKNSTPENPVVYVEIGTNGNIEAYRVEVNKIDLSNATLVEAHALAYFTTGSSTSRQMMIISLPGIFIGYGEEYPDSYLDTINIFEKVKKNVINAEELSASYRQNANANIDSIKSDGRWQNAVVQFLALCEVIDNAYIHTNPANRHSDDEFGEIKTIESGLWARGIDTTYPDGTKYSERIN